ncbi:MAG: Fic family protein [Crocinitomix sp.]|nr:Fic family protein [Crocinitomix sp.]
MSNKIHTFSLPLDFKLVNDLSAIDRFGGEWTAIEKREGARTLKELRSVATVQSTGASTRIEGSRMTDSEVQKLINDISISKLQERDQQEVLGYYNVLDIIIEAYQDINISESSIQNLHNQLLKHSAKDQWHKGKYKQNSNSVEATSPDGSKRIIFQTTPPGIETEIAMQNLIEWYNSDNTTPPIIKAAVFVYDFVSIHPFQDGNGRLSRLIGTLLLLKHGYPWIQYVSFEHEIESRKPEYYQVLMECQQQRPGEIVSGWVTFFVDCLSNIQDKLMQKLEGQKRENQLVQRERVIYTFIDSHPGTQSGEIAVKLGFALPTVKRALTEMVNAKYLVKHGTGKGTNYTTEKLVSIKTNVMMMFTDEKKIHEKILLHKSHFIEITKILLRPKFKWSDPNHWSKILSEEDISMTINCYSQNGTERRQSYPIDYMVGPMSYDPIFTLNPPIDIPRTLAEGEPNKNEYPIKVVIEIRSTKERSEFDVDLVYDAALE